MKVTRVTAAIDGLPERLSGLRILHISDVHARNPEEIVLNVWETAMKELDFDVVALTGDIIDRNVFQIEPHLPYIEAMAAEYPVYFVPGNHDIYSMRKLRPLLEAAEVTVLADELAETVINGETVEIIGLSDYYTADLEKQARLLSETGKTGGFRLLLVHQPQHVDCFDIAAPCLTLAGHTHGGQWRVPFMPVLYAPGQGFFPKYGNGVYELGSGVKMFVSKGVSSTGKAPFRFLNRPEICVIKLETKEEGEDGIS